MKISLESLCYTVPERPGPVLDPKPDFFICAKGTGWSAVPRLLSVEFEFVGQVKYVRLRVHLANRRGKDLIYGVPIFGHVLGEGFMTS